MKEKNQRFQSLIEQHKGILVKVARTYCQLPEDRQDLIQEISIQIWRSLDGYNDKYKVTTWLYRIALNVAVSFYRKNAKRQAKNVPWDEKMSQIETVDNYDREQQLSMLEQYISELNDLDKALMILYFEDKSHNEIAEILGISPSNVGTKIGRIKEKIKTRFSLIKS